MVCDILVLYSISVETFFKKNNTKNLNVVISFRIYSQKLGVSHPLSRNNENSRELAKLLELVTLNFSLLQHLSCR